MTSPVPNEFRCDGRFYALFNLPSNATEDDIRRAPPPPPAAATLPF